MSHELGKLKGSIRKLDIAFLNAEKLLDPDTSRKKTVRKITEVKKKLEEVFYLYDEDFGLYKESVLATGMTLEEFNKAGEGDRDAKNNDLSRESYLNKFLDLSDKMEDEIDDVEAADLPEAKPTVPVDTMTEAEINGEMDNIDTGIKDLGAKIGGYGDRSLGPLQAKTLQRLIVKFEERLQTPLQNMLSLLAFTDPSNVEILREKVLTFRAGQQLRLSILMMDLAEKMGDSIPAVSTSSHSASHTSSEKSSE